MKNKETLISNLTVLRNQLAKAEKVVGREYAENFVSTEPKEITKEDFYYESILLNLIEATNSVEIALNMLTEYTPESLVASVEKEDHDYKDLSRKMKYMIIEKKLIME